MSISLAIIRQYYRDDGGAERFVAKLLSELNTSEISTTLIARKWSSGKALDSARALRCNPLFVGRLMRDATFARSVSQAIKEHSFDLVQTNERIVGCDIFRAGDGVHRRWMAQKALQQSSWGKGLSSLDPYHVYVQAMERRLFEHPRLRAVICNSAMVQQEICEQFSISPDKVKVIYNGVDLESFHPDRIASQELPATARSISERGPVFLFVGSGFQRKGLQDAIQSIARISEAQLIVVGHSKRVGQYHAHAAQHGCHQRVHFAGKISDVRPYYAIASALILPTLYDPFPNVVLEAMACGVPAITTSACGARDVISSGENGFIGDVGDTEFFGECIGRLCCRSTREQFGIKARATVEPFTLERMQRETTQLYQRVLQEKRA